MLRNALAIMSSLAVVNAQWSDWDNDLSDFGNDLLNDFNDFDNAVTDWGNDWDGTWDTSDWDNDWSSTNNWVPDYVPTLPTAGDDASLVAYCNGDDWTRNASHDFEQYKEYCAEGWPENVLIHEALLFAGMMVLIVVCTIICCCLACCIFCWVRSCKRSAKAVEQMSK